MIPLWYQTHNQDGTSFFPLAYYIKRMQIGRYFTRPCWGDGELRLMLDETRLVKIRGGKLRPELLEAFLEVYSTQTPSLLSFNFFTIS